MRIAAGGAADAIFMQAYPPVFAQNVDNYGAF